MIEHQPMPVASHKPQSQIKVDLVNENNKMEELCLRICDELNKNEEIDKRWLAIGKTHIEQAFMAINRSIFKPNRVSF